MSVAPHLATYIPTNAYKYTFGIHTYTYNVYAHVYVYVCVCMKSHRAVLPASWVFALRLVAGIPSFEPFQMLGITHTRAYMSVYVCVLGLLKIRVAHIFNSFCRIL